VSARASSSSDVATSLFGRERELDLLRTFVERAAVDGDALLLTGDAGVGKTVLLDVAASLAVGCRVVRAAGAEFEADLSFAALHQILHPLLDAREQLRPIHQQALDVALGLDEGHPPDRMVISNAALALLSAAAVDAPVVLIVDDLQWLDGSSASVLAFVVRRLRGTRVGFLGAARSGEGMPFEPAAVTTREVQALDDANASALLADRFPALAPRVRQRLVAEAQGNPLALLELPVTLGPVSSVSPGEMPVVLPLSSRLQSVFSARVDELPPETRHLLLLAVLNGSGDLGVIWTDGSGAAEVDHLSPAERAGLVRLDERTGRLVFRHPLIRAAIVGRATREEIRDAHRTLAGRRSGDPARQAWHLAEAAIGPDELVAALLQSVAHSNLPRGAAVGAVAHLRRAAELSLTGSARSSRLAEAAYLGAIVLGHLREVPGRLDAVRRADPGRGGGLEGAVASAYSLIVGDGDVDSAHRTLLAAIAALDDPGDAHYRALIEALYNLLITCFFSGRAELWKPLHLAIDRLRPRPPSLLSILRETNGDVARVPRSTLDQLDNAIAALNSETSPARIVRIGVAASYVDRLPSCRAALWRVVRDGRDGGAVTSAIEALFLLGNDGFWAGNWDETRQLCDEGLELCEANGYGMLAPGQFYSSLIAAARGDGDTARAMADEMTRWAVPRRMDAVRFYACHVRAIDALSRGDFESAYQNATMISPAGELTSHVPHALWLILELVEAAARTGRDAEASAHVAAVLEARVAEISPRLALVTAAAVAMCSQDDEAQALFENALAMPQAESWPFDLARIHLNFGERLRRLKVTSEARRHLTAALDTFRQLGAEPWAARASAELRASGLTVDSSEASGALMLTPQQREIATLAAAGLTNKEIGERLFLSHRTVATHLYQLFPKLGVTSRAALRDALNSGQVRDDQPSP
jgi:DNA-binding CsgD family transcriptional regulator